MCQSYLEQESLGGIKRLIKHHRIAVILNIYQSVSLSFKSLGYTY